MPTVPTVELYARLSRATQELNLSDRTRLALTRAINQAVAISGATTQEASAGLDCSLLRVWLPVGSKARNCEPFWSRSLAWLARSLTVLELRLESCAGWDPRAVNPAGHHSGAGCRHR